MLYASVTAQLDLLSCCDGPCFQLRTIRLRARRVDSVVSSPLVRWNADGPLPQSSGISATVDALQVVVETHGLRQCRVLVAAGMGECLGDDGPARLATSHSTLRQAGPQCTYGKLHTGGKGRACVRAAAHDISSVVNVGVCGDRVLRTD